MVRTLMAGCLAGVVLCGAIAIAADPSTPSTFGVQPQQNMDQNMLAHKPCQASKLMGATVKNAQGEKLGTVDDLAIDSTSGKITHAILGRGGVLGVGEKLYPIPFAELKPSQERDETFFVLNVSKEKLDAAPTFDKNSWNNFANEQWRNQVDTYYHAGTERSAAHPVIP